MRSQILYLLLISSFLAVSFAADAEVSCTNVKNIFERKGMLSSVDIQEQPNSDADGLCLRNGCCGAGARVRLTQSARAQLEGALRSELNKLADILANRARKFDEFFRKLLQLSREEFHAMFKRTYGMIYEQHSYVFEQLFEQLERYYTRGDTDFDLMMDGFFGILYQKMFTVLNSQYSFDEKYLKCVNEHMRDIKPFEDVPHKLSVQLRRAFVATRTFHKALRAGADVVRNMMQVGVTQECVTAWARLRYCGTCSGAQPPACSRYCHNVLRGCLPAHADLGDQWDAYVDAVEKVADRLLGPFNIAMVVEPIDIKISEAIMSFQEHNQEISQKIFAGCGKPVLGGGGGAGPFFSPDRQKRSVRSLPDFDWIQRTNDVDDFVIETSYENIISDDFRTPEGIKRATDDMKDQAKSRDRFLQYMRGKINLEDYEEHERRRRDADPEPAAASGEINFKGYEFEGKRGGAKKKKPTMKNDDGHGAEWGGPALERLVRETRSRLRNSRRYWSTLGPVLCTSTSVTTSPCFNGTDVGSYTQGPAGEGSAALASNPEVRSIGTTVIMGSTTARAQQEALRTLTARLKDAYNGVEVQWKDAVKTSSTTARAQQEALRTLTARLKDAYNGVEVQWKDAVKSGSTTARAQQEALRTLTARLKDAYNGVEVQWKDAVKTGSTTARAQQEALRTLTARLKDAYNGVEVQWKDADDLQVASSNLDFLGSDGSGSGSGDDADDGDDLPDDDEDKQYPDGGSGDFAPPDMDPEEEVPDEDIGTRMEPAPPASEAPVFPDVPSIVDTPNTNNVHIRGRERVLEEPPQPDQPEPSEEVTNNGPRGQDVVVRPPETPTSSANNPSLHKALFTYALPVVCAWFGTIVTDLF
ncbi:hypothetical protein O0L34_g8345 [Tuta absoluta]|nr:hypothetical protein O0L34_g8345 [Tuta absoluta]